MRILVHDYSGHPFQAQLSRALAARGHAVLHLHAPFFQTPKGNLAPAPGDPPGFAIEGVGLGAPFAKYSFVKRRAQEIAYGAILAGRAAAFGPEVVLCANAPLDALAGLARWCRSARVPFVFWVQDLYSVAIDRLLRRRLGPLGAAIGAHYRALERCVARDAAALVLITEDFRPTLEAWGVERGRMTVIENWAPLDELPPRPRDNDWARAEGLRDKTVLLYSGTLGMKHDPQRLAELARHFARNAAVELVIVSEGPGAEWLANVARADGLANLRVLPFQPYAHYPDVLGSADVLVAILEADAGIFSVPSKVLSYFCAGRPILASLPGANLAARLITREEAGIVAEPDDANAFAAAAARLVADPGLRARLGKNALDYARETFDIGAIATRFEAVFRAARAGTE
ncbi:MAG TPA: glycosyltransferase family 4 protein [Alphaproteobacteria bacterium]|nr:glycosyltransferase family 4 protein [Alphaproteobacteria bacterium]